MRMSMMVIWWSTSYIHIIFNAFSVLFNALSFGMYFLSLSVHLSLLDGMKMKEQNSYSSGIYVTAWPDSFGVDMIVSACASFSFSLICCSFAYQNIIVALLLTLLNVRKTSTYYILTTGEDFLLLIEPRSRLLCSALAIIYFIADFVMHFGCSRVLTTPDTEACKLHCIRFCSKENAFLYECLYDSNGRNT